MAMLVHMLLIAGASAIILPTNYPTTEPTFASKKDWVKAEKTALEGKASGKVCKGGVVNSLDQYVDCETLIGFLSIVVLFAAGTSEPLFFTFYVPRALG